jgi:hypothetical protein
VPAIPSEKLLSVILTIAMAPRAFLAGDYVGNGSMLLMNQTRRGFGSLLLFTDAPSMLGMNG